MMFCESSLKCLTALLALTATYVSALSVNRARQNVIQQYPEEPLQDIVTWDSHSLLVHGERVLFYSGEFHPFRLPVPGLWLDVLQKIKALGYNGISFYTDWALLEGKPGEFSSDGIFDLEPFFEAAKTAGIYLLARPGPYINAEVSGGGFPGWLQRNPARLRTRDQGFLSATENYVDRISQIIAAAQITNGGPVILVQPENEYSQADPDDPEFPDPVYFQYVQDQYRKNGIVVPLISNDAYPHGYFADGPPRQEAAVDIYGHDGYPLGFDCAHPTTWPSGALPTFYGDLHQNQSSSTPYSIIEFQAGSFDPWGGPGFVKCTQLLGPEFERVFYKNDFSFGVTIFNLYMTYGGTNWGNLGHPGGYTSYDYGAVIAEDRSVAREKYSEAKLLANFLQASSAYLTAVPQNNSHAAGAYTGNADLFVTALLRGGRSEKTNFFVIRHSAYESLATTKYSVTLPTAAGNVTIPQLNSATQLSLHGRDSKIFVTDYDLDGVTLLYSTAEIFTWKRYGSRRVLVVYGNIGEYNEIAVKVKSKNDVVEGGDVMVKSKGGATVLGFTISKTRRVVNFGCGLFVYVLDRSSAYNYWVIDAPNDNTTGNYTSVKRTISAPIVRAGYLLRTVTVIGDCMEITGDVNATTPLEIIGGAPNKLRILTFNGRALAFSQDSSSVVTASITYNKPALSIPDLSTLQWKVIDSLPEIQSTYEDAAWTLASLTYSNNTARNLTTPTSLYASDYGYHTGNLLYRGHFIAKEARSTLKLTTAGGSAYGHSVWLNGTFVGSFLGTAASVGSNSTYVLNLTVGQRYVITVLIDNMGLDENGEAGSSQMKNPRGILDYSLSAHAQSDLSWRLTGNLGGEDYADHSRGPLNEGGLWAERQGYHLPGAPIQTWNSSGGPLQGFNQTGVAFYAADLELNLPSGYDVPLSLVFSNSTAPTAYRAQIYVNGFQYGKYVSNIGPQLSFPVPQGIWNYNGNNRLAVSLWALTNQGARLEGFALQAGWPVASGYDFARVGEVQAATWSKRPNAY